MKTQLVENQLKRPSLDNIRTVGMNLDGAKAQEINPRQKQVEYNRKRSKNTSFLRKQNIELINATKDYLATKYQDKDHPQHLINLKKRLWFSSCEQLSLFREFTDGAVSFVGSIDSGHKLDALSNSRRSKALRKKYWGYFQENSKTAYTGKINKKTGEPIEKDILGTCDFMHLVLTVPHTNGGYDGKRFYAREIMAKFNLMRKYGWFKKHIYGGEYSCEIVRKNDNGLHIHLHVLLVVHKSIQNRNKLLKHILVTWNALTATKEKKDSTLNHGQLEYLFNLELTNEKREKYKVFTHKEVGEFNGSGATQIWLENLFTTSDHKETAAHKWHEGLGKWIRRVKTPTTFDKIHAPEKYQKCLNDLLGGIMECLKYHFEPFALKDKDGNFDMGLVDEILPNIYRQPLYRKFGAFHGVKELNVNFQATPEEQAQEILDEYGNEEIVHPETLEPVDRAEYRYFRADPMYAFYDGEKADAIKIVERRRKYFGANEPPNLFQAITQMVFEYLDGNKRNENKIVENERVAA